MNVINSKTQYMDNTRPSLNKMGCFNIIRLLAAIQVVYGHTLIHLNINQLPPPL